MIALNYYAYDLKFSEVFAVSSNARTSTELIFVELSFAGKTGYGQASYPPYMKETRGAGLLFLSQLDTKHFAASAGDISVYLDSISKTNMPAKAAIDMALYDLAGKLKGETVRKTLKLETTNSIHSSFTIGIGNDDFILRQLQKAQDYKTIKIKMGGDVDYNKHVIELVRKHASHPIGVDFNQGLADRETAIQMLEWLSHRRVDYAEQPLPAEKEADYIWLKTNSPMDIFGDESIQGLADIINKSELFHGVNIKLMKSGGINKALEMAALAKARGLKLMIGCMAESSCAVTAAANIAGLFDRVDLDGHLLNANDPIAGLIMECGELNIPDIPGLGISKIA